MGIGTGRILYGRIWREKVLEEIAVIGVYWESGVGTQCSGNFLESMGETLVRSPSNGVNRAQLAIFCSYARILVVRLHSVELLAVGVL